MAGEYRKMKIALNELFLQDEVSLDVLYAMCDLLFKNEQHALGRAGHYVGEFEKNKKDTNWKLVAFYVEER